MRVSNELQKFRNEFLLDFKRLGMNTTTDDARFLRILIESSRAKNGLEIGVANGHGSIVMGLGFERNNGCLTGIEFDVDMVQRARTNIKKMKLHETVKIVKGDASKIIPRLPGLFDFVFLDATKDEYLDYLLAIEPKLKTKAIIVADNVIRHADRMQNFFDAVRSNPKYQSLIVRASEEKHDGMMLIYKS
jgi:predicted O-methyltransferase YrrM